MDLSQMQLKWENMRRGIEGQVELLTSAPRTLYEQACRALPEEAPTRLYYIGCGDSHFCGLSARLATELWSGVPTEPLESLEFSRYAVRSAPPGSLVVAVSNSGEVARSIEGLKFARQADLRTVGVTYKSDSRLAAQAERTLPYDYRDVGFGPGTMSYLASLLALYAVGLRVGRLTDRLTDDEVEDEIAKIEALGPVLKATIDAADASAREVTSTWTDDTSVFFLGAGPNYGTALFAMAKMIEAARHNAVAQQLEEWAHEQFFCCTEGTATVVIAPPGASVDRAREQLQAVRDMKGTAVAVCSADDHETAALADVVLPVAGQVDEALSPLVYCVAPELLAYHFALANDKTMLGFDDDWRKEVNFRQIFRSAIPDALPTVGGQQ